jgi:hypothetical protein
MKYLIACFLLCLVGVSIYQDDIDDKNGYNVCEVSIKACQ